MDTTKYRIYACGMIVEEDCFDEISIGLFGDDYREVDIPNELIDYLSHSNEEL